MSNLKLEKIKKLNEACDILKSEFIGLDDIIDKLKLSITPWYITPEVIERPVVVSLWGMTGTGKTSIIHRLVELLDITPQALFFDCGSENKDGGNDLSDTLRDFITSEGDSENPIRKNEVKSFALVFDEFQYARTLDEHGEEVDKPNLRPIWNLLDSGKLYINSVSRYDLGYFNDFIEDLSAFAQDHSDMPLKDGMVEKKEDVKELLDVLGFFYYDRGVPNVMDPCSSYGYDSSMFKDDEDSDPYRPIRVIEDRLFRIIYRKSGIVGKKPTEILDMLSCKTLGELVSILKGYKTKLNTAEEINCSKSIIFVVGNLDEAFKVSNDFNPDMSADVFYEETSKVTDSDIKDALKSRFRAEQIARFGNSLIKYPSLSKDSFEKIIKKEVERICTTFEETEGIKLIIESDFYDLVYSEGVYPVQGVRPVFTTIGTMFTPLLSKIVIRLKGDDKKSAKFKQEARIGVENPETGYKLDSKTVFIKYKKGKNYFFDKVVYPLSLGESRNPVNRKNSYICSVHETGHAIMMSYLTGKVPTSIVSVSTDHGGFCVTFDKDKVGEIDSKQDVANEVMIGLGGYEAEQLIFKERPEMTLLGSSSDISSNWDILSDAAYSSGYFNPFAYSNAETEQTNGGPASGFKDNDLYPKIVAEFERLRKDTQNILNSNKTLIVETALILGERGEISGDEFKELISKYGNTLTLKKMETVEKLNSPDWYKEVLLRLKK